jgi:hypothetical protein
VIENQVVRRSGLGHQVHRSFVLEHKRKREMMRKIEARREYQRGTIA